MIHQQYYRHIATMFQNNARTLFTNLLELFIDYYGNWVAIESVCVYSEKKKLVRYEKGNMKHVCVLCVLCMQYMICIEP